MNTGLVVVGAVVAVVAAGLGSWWWRDRARILAAPVVGPGGAGMHTGNFIIGGVARGIETTSPWTERRGLLFSADELVEREERDREGRTQRRTSRHSLGVHAERIEIHDPHDGSSVEIRSTDKISFRHFPKLTTSSRGGRLPSISIGSISLASDRSRVEEVAVVDGDRVWVLADVETGPDGRSAISGKQVWSAKAPDAMASHLTMKVAGAAGAAAVGLVLVLVGLLG